MSFLPPKKAYLLIAATTLASHAYADNIFTNINGEINNFTRVNGQVVNNTFCASDNGGVLYVGTWFGISVTSDNGANWTNINASNFGSVAVVDAIYANGNMIYAANGTGLYISDNSGASWSHKTGMMTQSTGGIFSIYSGSSALYLAKNGGLSISTDSGETWSNYSSSNGLGNNYVMSVIEDNIGNIYAGTYGGGISVSSNNGASWTTYTTANGLGSNNIRGLTFLQTSNPEGEIYAATDNGVSVSSNGGASWTTYTTANSGLADNFVRCIYMSVQGWLYAGTNNGLSVSTNGGHTWANYTPANSGIPYGEPVDFVLEYYKTGASINNPSVLIGGYGVSIADRSALTLTPVPEPSTYGLMGVGALSLAMVARRRKAKKS